MHVEYLDGLLLASLTVTYGGERSCPPEDVEGKSGYTEFLEVIRNHDDEQHNYFMEWSGGNFNLEKYSIETVNEQLRGLTRMRK